MSRRLLVAGYWKMNLGRSEAESLAMALAPSGAETPSVDIAIFPPFPWIIPVRAAVAGSGIAVGAQNCHDEQAGAFTGEAS